MTEPKFGKWAKIKTEFSNANFNIGSYYIKFGKISINLQICPALIKPNKIT